MLSKTENTFATVSKEIASIVQNLPSFASPHLTKLITLAQPSKTFVELQLELNIPLPQIYRIVSHLVFWKIAKIISPITKNNTYMVHPKFVSNKKIENNFGEDFKGRKLSDEIERFSVPLTLKQHLEKLEDLSQQQFFAIVIWLLKNHVLSQLYTYIFLLLPSKVSLSQFLDTLDLKNPQHLLFSKIHIYFNKQHTVEEIMWRSNCTRHDIDQLLQTFSSVLVTTTHDQTEEVHTCFLNHNH